MKNIAIQKIKKAVAAAEALATEIWNHGAERAFKEGDGRLFLCVEKPDPCSLEAGITAFADGEKTVLRIFPRFVPGEMRAPEGIKDPAFLVADLCRSVVEDVIDPKGKSLLDGKDSKAINAGELVYNLISRMQEAVKNGIQPFRVPDHLLWSMTSDTLDPDEVRAVTDLMQHDPTSAGRLKKIKATAEAGEGAAEIAKLRKRAAAVIAACGEGAV